MSTPKLRFKEFKDPWITVKLSNVTTLITAGKSKVIKSESLSYPIIGSTDIIGYSDSYDYDGDFILVARVGANAGKISTYTGKCKITDNTIFFECEKANKNFIIEVLRKKNLNRISFGSGQPLVKASDLKNLKIKLPSINEQQKIASLFNTFNKKIQLQKEKIDLLKQQKKGLMQKIFSQELRFKSKDGSEYPDWKLTTLAEVATSIQYGMNAAAKEYDGENIYLRITDIDDEYRTFLEDSKVSPDASLDEKYRLKEGDILFARTGASVGKSFYFSGENRPFYFAGFLIRVRLKNGINSNFVYQNTLTSSYRRWVKVMSMRSGQPGINGEEYGSFTFKLPCLEEQTKIANFLTKLDKRIILEENKKKMLHKKKEAFMQQMFI